MQLVWVGVAMLGLIALQAPARVAAQSHQGLAGDATRYMALVEN